MTFTLAAGRPQRRVICATLLCLTVVEKLNNLQSAKTSKTTFTTTSRVLGVVGRSVWLVGMVAGGWES